jgi:WD40 repeat protein
MAIKCPKCQSDNPSDSKYCKECASPLTTESKKEYKEIITRTKTLKEDQQARPTENIGPYKILEVIGSGGLGTVYLAQQEKPIKRKVALKIIKPGMNSEEIIARFESEQQALALMNHPNIAQVYGSGSTEQGYPYFVMEYVPGLPITEYCDRHKMTTQERLTLFQDVCNAVQHAHYKGIVHRDLKPSNVLVTFQNDKHVPKIIDFGIAKALTGQGLTEKTLHTLHNVAIGTPAYMSPEQAELTGYDIDTRTDVYSLGILLYELLVGVTPFDQHELERAGLAEILRIIREVEPPKPTTRFNSLGDTSNEVAKKRGTTPLGMIKQLKGDLECILMKAVEKDRKRRYSSAVELAEDINRFLDQKPIHARPPSFSYTINKYIRRHKTACSAALLFLLFVIVAYAWNILERQKAVKLSREASYNLAIALKEKAKASAEINQWQLVKLFSANSLLYQERAQKQLPMGDIELPFGKTDWVLRKRISSKDPRSFWISPDCKYVAYKTDLGDTLKVMEILEGKDALTLKGIKQHTEAPCFSNDGRFLAAGGGDDLIKIWDLYTGDEVGVLKGDVILMSFINNGKYLASYGGETIKIWEISNGKVVKNVKVQSFGNSLDISPDGKYLTVNNESFNVIEIIDVSNGKVIDTMKGRKLGKCFSPLGKYIAIGSLADEIMILESSSRKKVYSLSGHDVTVLCFSPNERYLDLGGRDNSIKVYDLENGNNYLTLRGHNGPITSLDFSHDNIYLVSGSQDKTIKLWNLWNGNEVSTLLGHDRQDIVVRFSPDNSYILSNCSNKINIWELSRSDAATSLLGHNDIISSAQFSPSGKYFASASYDKTIKIWEISSGKVMSIIKGHNEGITSMCFSPDGNYLASGSKDKTVRVWDISTGKEIALLSNPSETEILSVNFGINGDSLSFWARNGFACFWELG